MMAYWNCKDRKIHYSPAKDLGNGWCEIDCGCSGGLQWGGNEPRECNKCQGSGIIYWHINSKVFSLFPGGPFVCGRGDLTERELYGGYC